MTQTPHFTGNLRCGYKECTRTCRLTGPEHTVPSDWSSIVIASDTPHKLETFLFRTHLDGVLCPEHLEMTRAALPSTGPGCSYSGCFDGMDNLDSNDAIKQGWRSVLVGRKLLKPADVLEAEVDGLVCPRHFVQVMRRFTIGASYV